MTGTCHRCAVEFEYEWRGRRRGLCDACGAAAKVRASARCVERLRRCPKEAVGQSLDGCAGVALRTQEEVAQMMSIDRRNVQQLERRAFWKIRQDKKLRVLWGEYLEVGRAGRGVLMVGELMVDGSESGPAINHQLSTINSQVDAWENEHYAALVEECPEEAAEVRRLAGSLRAIVESLNR